MNVTSDASNRPVAGCGRHLLSIVLLPFMNTVVIPVAILALSADAGTLSVTAAIRSPAWAAGAIGGVALAVGLTLVVASIGLFAARGRGTLAPWDPPQRLVVCGPYRYVRNPMKAGLVFVLVAESLLLHSLALAVWSALFATVNVVYIRVSEEPGLRARFGQAYSDYCAAVPAWWPRLSPWSPRSDGDAQLPRGIAS